MLARSAKVINPTGLHARPATLFVETARRYSCAIRVARGDQEVDARSVVGLMLLEAIRGTEITIKAEGEDEASAIQALVELVESGFIDE